MVVGSCGVDVSVEAAIGDILWTFDTGAPVFASPTLGRDGSIFVGSNANTFSALTPTDSDPRLRWIYQADDWIDATAAIGDDGTVYVGTYNSTFVALEPDTGEVRWEIQVGASEGQFGVIQASQPWLRMD